MKYGFSLVPTIYRAYLVVVSPQLLVIEIRKIKIAVLYSQAKGYFFLPIYLNSAIQLDL